MSVDGFENMWLNINIDCKMALIIGVIDRTKNNLINCARALDVFLPDISLLTEYIIILGNTNIDCCH